MEAVVTPSEMGAIDAAAPEPVEVLVERAGAAVARAAIELMGGGYGRRVVVVAGKGNNGADGRAAARRLAERGVRCLVLDAANAPASLPRCDLVVDAAYGTGFRGEFVAPALPEPAPPVLAVDIPSGVSGLTGEACGRPWAARRTVTFAALKPGLLVGAGAGLAGAVTVADIGLDVSVARAHLLDAAAVGSRLPERPRDSHKWRSAVRLVAGSPGMTGAAHLATRAAQRAGAGYVRLSTPGSDSDPFAPTEAVVTGLGSDGWATVVLDDLDRFRALAIGPGLGRDDGVHEQVRELVSRSRVPVVVDGDGLRALGGAAASVVGARGDGAAPVVLTPHEGEFEALAGHPPGRDRFAAVRDLAARTGAVVLLKGSTTLVSDPDGRVLVSTAGDARLATAGTGDVLTGVLAGLLAQGLEARWGAAVAAEVHGRAGALAWRRGLVAGDLPDLVPAVLHQLGA